MNTSIASIFALILSAISIIVSIIIGISGIYFKRKSDKEFNNIYKQKIAEIESQSLINELILEVLSNTLSINQKDKNIIQGIKNQLNLIKIVIDHMKQK